MTISVTFDTSVRIVFTVTNDVTGDVFTDGFVFPAGQVPANPVLRTMAQARYQAWRAIVTAPPPVLTLADKIAIYQARRAERMLVQSQLDGEDPAVVAAAG